MKPHVIIVNSEWSFSITYSKEDKQQIELFTIVYNNEGNPNLCTKLDIPLVRWNRLELDYEDIMNVIQEVKQKSAGVDQQFCIGGGLEIRVSSENDYVHMCMFKMDFDTDKVVPSGPQLQMPFAIWDLLWQKINNAEEIESRSNKLACFHANQEGEYMCHECNPYGDMDYLNDFHDTVERDFMIPWAMVNKSIKL